MVCGAESEAWSTEPGRTLLRQHRPPDSPGAFGARDLRPDAQLFQPDIAVSACVVRARVHHRVLFLAGKSGTGGLAEEAAHIGLGVTGVRTTRGEHRTPPAGSRTGFALTGCVSVRLKSLASHRGSSDGVGAGELWSRRWNRPGGPVAPRRWGIAACCARATSPWSNPPNTATGTNGRSTSPPTASPKPSRQPASTPTGKPSATPVSPEPGPPLTGWRHPEPRHPIRHRQPPDPPPAGLGFLGADEPGLPRRSRTPVWDGSSAPRLALDCPPRQRPRPDHPTQHPAPVSKPQRRDTRATPAHPPVPQLSLPAWPVRPARGVPPGESPRRIARRR